MELSPGSVTVRAGDPAAEPDDPLDDAWEEAYAMVEGYYSALRIRNRLLLSRIIALILRRAARRLPNEPQRKPAELAMQEALTVVADWFQRVLAMELPDQRLAARGRLALLIADMPGRWTPSRAARTLAPLLEAGSQRPGSIKPDAPPHRRVDPLPGTGPRGPSRSLYRRPPRLAVPVVHGAGVRLTRRRDT